MHRGGGTNYLKLMVNDKKDCIANVYIKPKVSNYSSKTRYETPV